LQVNKFGVAFASQYGAVDESAIANTVIFKVDDFESDTDFLNFVANQREKQDDKKRFKIISITNEQVSHKDAAFLKFRGLSEDDKSGPRRTNRDSHRVVHVPFM
jgi:hypothetical protein